MDIKIKAESIVANMGGDIQVNGAHPGTIIKAIIQELGINGFMDCLNDHVTESEWVDVEAWLSENHGLVEADLELIEVTLEEIDE